MPVSTSQLGGSSRDSPETHTAEASIIGPHDTITRFPFPFSPNSQPSPGLHQHRALYPIPLRNTVQKSTARRTIPGQPDIAAYSINNNLLGFFTEAGFSNGNGDGSAIFLGVNDDVPEIGSIAYSIVSCSNDCNDFAISQITVNTATPEPSSLALLGLGEAVPYKSPGRK